MKTVKLLLAIIAVTFTVTMATAGNGFKNVLIQEQSEQTFNLKTELEANESMQILITNEEGELVVSEEITDSPRIVNKTYDFNKARFGAYTLKVTINGELVKTTVIGEEEVTLQDEFSIEVY